MKKVAFLLCGLIVFVSGAFADAEVGDKASEVTLRQWLTPNAPDEKNLDGMPYVVEFWATWCKPCVKNIPHLVEINRKYRDSGLKILGLCQDKAPEKIMSLIAEHQVDYSVAIDNGSADWFAVRYYPTAVVVDHTGTIVWRGLPWRSGFEKAIREVIEKAPPQFLGDIDLGPFEVYKQALKGGDKFVDAYYKVNSYAVRDESSTAELAKIIIDRINEGLEKQIAAAEKISESDPLSALCVYDEIARRYGGITPAIRAKILKQQLAEKLYASSSSRSGQAFAFFYNTDRTTDEHSRN